MQEKKDMILLARYWLVKVTLLTFEYWGGEYRPLEELIKEMDDIKKKSR